jgi:hypothetical protein
MLKNCTWRSHCLYVLCMDLRTIWNFYLIYIYIYIYIFKYLVLYNRGGKCLLRGTQWVLIWNRVHFVSQVLNSIILVLYSAVLHSYIGYIFYSTLSRTLNSPFVSCYSNYSFPCLRITFSFHSLRISSINILKRLGEADCHSWISLYWYINRARPHFLDT